MPVGSIRPHVTGYVTVKVGLDHWASQGGGWGLEHRVVMGDHLGRALIEIENVHHRNGDKADNRIENLELWVRSQPKGQRAAELLAWAREIVATYGPIEDRL